MQLLQGELRECVESIIRGLRLMFTLIVIQTSSGREIKVISGTLRVDDRCISQEW